MKSVFAFFAVLVSVSASYAGINEDLVALKDTAKDYEVTGTICEEVARLRLAEQYKTPEYNVLTGIAYRDSNRTIGELDVIVFESKTHQVVKIAEVKCWKNMSSGLNKARDQRKRFLKAIRSNTVLYFESTTTHERFNSQDFKKVTDFVSMAQKGSAAVGYDLELTYTLGELMGMRQSMITCQRSGDCAPSHH